MTALTVFTLPRAAPRRVLACGAFLKNTACLLDGDRLWLSPLHGDLGTPDACAQLATSMEALLQAAGGPIDAVAHDLHPDFDSTRRAHALAAQLGVPAIGVQHHHAHIAAVQAEQGSTAPVVGLALDGVGLGTDGSAWGGELLWVQGAQMRRLGHLTDLRLPGGDVAAREPWRMAAAALHAMGRGDEIVPRFGPWVGEASAALLRTMLARGLNCPTSTSAGRWFDAAAGLLGARAAPAADDIAVAAAPVAQGASVALAGQGHARASDPPGQPELARCLRRQTEAEAAMALERLAGAWLADHPAPVWDAPSLDLRPLLARMLTLHDAAHAAALFHAGLAQALAEAAISAARAEGITAVSLSGGCFYNRVLSELLAGRLAAAGLAVQRPLRWGCGDAGLAPGQAWAAAHALALARSAEEAAPCA